MGAVVQESGRRADLNGTLMDVTSIAPDKLSALERRLEGEHYRRSIRRSLAEWARYKGFEPAAHHLLIIKELEDFVFGNDYEVLLLQAPPGSAKSTYVSVLFPPWYFANFPQNNILFGTHSVDFAQRWAVASAMT